jgi:two-component system phosphate regulon response regulator PhoB
MEVAKRMSSTLARRQATTQPSDDNLEVVFIGDDRSLAELYRLKLELDGYWVTTYSSIDDGLEHIRTRMPDLLFVDLGAASRRKSEKLGVLRSDPQLQEVPIVLLARGEIEAAGPKALQLGGRDFLVRVDSVPGEDFWTDTTHEQLRPRHI